MHVFLANHRDELVESCKQRVALRPRRDATQEQLKNGVPMFIEQLIRTLAAEEEGKGAESLRISGASGGDLTDSAGGLTEMGVSATAHGRQLLDLGFSVDQVVHDYGDLCQAITDLAVKLDAPFGVDEFRTLNRCLDNAISDAVSAFSAERDTAVALAQETMTNERLGFLVHELRNSLSTAMLAVAALEVGNLPIAGATGAVLKRSHAGLKVLMDAAISDLRRNSDGQTATRFSVKDFVGDAAAAAQLYAASRQCTLKVLPVSSSMAVVGNRQRLDAALGNLVQNAFRYTHAGTEVILAAYERDGFVRIDVRDHCGGVPDAAILRMFTPFANLAENKVGLGLGLSISRQSVELDGGTLSMQNLPGEGCIFTIQLPRHENVEATTEAGGPA